MTQPKKLFCSFSRSDEPYRKLLQEKLSVLERNGLISFWTDRRIVAGAEWKQEISRQLDDADIILLLVSSDFLSSSYCYDIELKHAMERHLEGTAIVVPILIKPCDWRHSPFASLNALPDSGRPVTQWASEEEAWSNIAECIQKLAADGVGSTTDASTKRTPATSAKKAVIESAGGRCAVCGNASGSALTMAHIRADEPATVDNLICLCANCHARVDKENWSPSVLEEYRVSPWAKRQQNSVADSGDGPPGQVWTLTVEGTIDAEHLQELRDSIEALLKERGLKGDITEVQRG